MQTDISATSSSYTVKIRNVDGETRRFGYSGTSFAGLVAVVKQLLVIPEYAPIALKWKDEEGDLITMGSDAELAEAVRASAGSVLHLMLGGPQAPLAPAAPVMAPVMAPCVVTPAPAVVAAPMFPSPSGPFVPKGQRPLWKEEKSNLVRQWKEEKHILKQQIKDAKSVATTDKKDLKRQINDLRTQVRVHKQELKRMPKDNIMLARFVKDVSLPDGTEVAPGTPVVKTWRMRNESAKAWPEGTRLLWVGRQADRLGAPEAVAVPVCQPGEEVEISVPLVAPMESGRYTAYFRLVMPNGRKFGQRLWASVSVYASSSESDKESGKCSREEALSKYGLQLKTLGEMGYVDLDINIRLLRRFDGNLEKAVAVLIKRQQRKHAYRT